MRLFWMYVGDQQRKLVPLYLVSLIFMLISVVTFRMFGAYASGFLSLVSNLSLVFSLLICGLCFAVCFLFSAFQFRDTFFTGPAFLYRTLPLKRMDLYAACFGSAAFCLLETSLWLTAMICLDDFEVITGLLKSLSGQASWLLWLGIGVFLQQLVVVLNAQLGILIGYSRNSDQAGWSILAVLVLYLLTQLLLGAGIIPYILAHPDLRDSMELLPSRSLAQLLAWISFLYLAALLIYLGIILPWIRRGMDAAG